MPTAFEEVLDIRGMGMPADGEVTLTGADPVLSTQFRGESEEDDGEVIEGPAAVRVVLAPAGSE